jgi:transposase InsO family protein
LPDALRYYKRLGVKIEQVMTDNGSADKSRRFAKPLRRLRIKHIRTRPYTPRTNGKAERFIQTLLREWAYAFIYPSSDHRISRVAALDVPLQLPSATLRNLSSPSHHSPRLRREQRVEKLQLAGHLVRTLRP